MSRIAYTPPVSVGPAKRRYLTKAQKLARWAAVGGRCVICHEPCEPYGPTVIWDHRIGVWFGEETDPDRMDPHHAVGCAPSKTANDATIRAKVKRIIAKAVGQPRKPSRIKSRGFGPSRPFPKRSKS